MRYDHSPLTRKKVILGILAGIVLLAVLWLSRLSIVTISVNNPAAASGAKYTLTDSSGKSTSGNISGRAMTKIVKKGEYQITVRETGTSYVSFVRTAGFLRKTTVAAQLSPESARRFVGNNPAPCMYYVGSTLLSSPCGGAYENTQIHQPAADTQPTTVAGIVPYNAYGPSEGIVETKFGPVVLIQSAYSEDEPRGHYASIIGADLQDSGRTRLDGLATDRTYAMKPYQDGFIAYDTEFRDIFYVASLTSRPVRIAVPAPKDRDMKPYLIGVNGDSIVLAYSSQPTDNIAESREKPQDTSVLAAEIVVISGGNNRRFEVQGFFSGVASCGTGKLCLLNNEKLQVYDIRSDSAKSMFTVNGVKAMEPGGTGLIAVTGDGALRLDIDNRTGFIDYSFGGYSFCGITKSASDYLLCVENSKLGRNALLVGKSAGTDTALDKKALQIVDTPGISYVSAYGEYLYVVPDYGEDQYDAVMGIYTTNQATKQFVDRRITSAITKSGLDKPPYRVINTGL